MTNSGHLSETTSTSLVSRARQFDPSAWQRLVKLYGPLVYRWARTMGLQSDDAMDIGQDVFRTVMAKIPEFRRDRAGESFRAWLWVITRYKLMEFRRRDARTPRALGGEEATQLFAQLSDAPPEEFDDNPHAAHAELLQKALQLVRPEVESKTWQAFWRSTVANEKADDIAIDLRMTSKAVRQAKYRVLKRLRSEFGDLL